MKLSKDQEYALDQLLNWFKSGTPNQYITLGGYAGTGKTTLIARLRNELHKISPKTQVSFVSYTGKAAQVLKSQISTAKAKRKGDYVGTIHSLIYSPLVNETTQEIIGWDRKDKVNSDLIIIDEASMVDQTIWQDLLTYATPIIAVGDHGQLPPIKGKFNLMKAPALKLEEIHRQAKGNPIIQLSKTVRETGTVPIKKYSDHVIKYNKQGEDIYSTVGDLLESYNDETLILCGYNKTRIKLNTQIRQNKGYESEAPRSGDKVICLRNNHKKQIFNGMLGHIQNITPEAANYYAEIEMEDGTYFNGMIAKEQFNSPNPLNFSDKRKKSLELDLFDFGYAMTVHKSQGSQAQKVILFEERFPQMSDDMWKRWLYTAVTRAERELYIIG